MLDLALHCGAADAGVTFDTPVWKAFCGEEEELGVAVAKLCW